MKSNRLYPDEQELLRCDIGEFLAPHHQKAAWREKRKQAVADHLQAKAEREGRPFRLRKGRAAA